jgi:4-hydroxy-tetrahydrodipicolinate synthase
MHDICELFFSGKHEDALQLQLKTLSLINSLFIETNPIPVKTAMNLMGLEIGNLRLPLCDMNEDNLKILTNEMKSYGLI